MRPTLSVRYVVMTVYGLALCSCETPPTQRLSATDLVPSSSLIVASLKWPTLSADASLRQIVNGDALAKVFGTLGIGEGQVSQVVVFSDGRDDAAASNGVMLVGSFDSRAVLESLEKRGWTQVSYPDRVLYVNPTDQTRVASIGSGALVAGSGLGVTGVIDAARQPESRLKSGPPFDRLFKHFEGTPAPISMIMTFPQTVQDMGDAAIEMSSVALRLAGVGPLARIFERIGFARGLGCTISRNGSAFPLELMAVMQDERSASFVSGALNLLKGFSALVPQDNLSPSDREAFQTFNSMTITRDGEVLLIRTIMPENEFVVRENTPRAGSAVPR